MIKRGEGAGSDIHAIGEREQPCDHNKNRDDAEKAPDAEAAGAHGGDFAIGGEAAEANEDADEDAHGDGVGERDRDGEEEDLGDAGERGAVADDEFENASEIAREKNEREDGCANERVGDDFSQDVASEDADPHDGI